MIALNWFHKSRQRNCNLSYLYESPWGHKWSLWNLLDFELLLLGCSISKWCCYVSLMSQRAVMVVMSMHSFCLLVHLDRTVRCWCLVHRWDLNIQQNIDSYVFCLLYRWAFHLYVTFCIFLGQHNPVIRHVRFREKTVHNFHDKNVMLFGVKNHMLVNSSELLHWKLLKRITQLPTTCNQIKVHSLKAI